MNDLFINFLSTVNYDYLETLLGIVALLILGCTAVALMFVPSGAIGAFLSSTIITLILAVIFMKPLNTNLGKELAGLDYNIVSVKPIEHLTNMKCIISDKQIKWKTRLEENLRYVKCTIKDEYKFVVPKDQIECSIEWLNGCTDIYYTSLDLDTDKLYLHKIDVSSYEKDFENVYFLLAVTDINGLHIVGCSSLPDNMSKQFKELTDEIQGGF